MGHVGLNDRHRSVDVVKGTGPIVNHGLVSVHRRGFSGVIKTLDAEFMGVNNAFGLGLQLSVILLGSVLEESKVEVPWDGTAR